PAGLRPRLLPDLAALRRHEPEDDLLRAPRQEPQRLEASGALVVPLHEEAVDLELVEERLRNVVVASFGRPARAEVAAAHVRRHAHPVRASGKRLVDVVDVLDMLSLGIAADRRDVLTLL